MDLSNENIVHIKEKDCEYIQFRKLLEYEKYVKHIIPIGKNLNFRTSSKVRTVTPKEYEQAMKNYEVFAKKIGSHRKDVVKPDQNHTNKVEKVVEKIHENREDLGKDIYPNIDGLITDKKEMLLATTSADCLNLLFYDTKNKVIANVHSGWKGTVGRISANTIRKMKEEYGSNPKDIICCMCPAIQKYHFEVKEDVKNIFEKEFKDIFKQIEEGKIKYNKEDIIEEKIKNYSWYIDNALINKIIMLNEGLKEENIIDSKICTVCNSDKMNSYRADGKNFGLNVALIKLI